MERKRRTDTMPPTPAGAPEAEVLRPVEVSTEENQELIETLEAESPTRKLIGFWAFVVTALAVGLSVYALYATRVNISTQIYRTTFLGFALVLTFLLYPWRQGRGRRVSIVDLALCAASIAVAVYPILDFDEFIYRAARPNETDVWMGTLCIALILEATRRTIGWILPIVAGILLAYGFWGDIFPGQWGHRGYELDRVIGTLYISLEGIFGTPIDVAATYIILFTIYGAVLEFSGAGKFFLDFSFAATGRKASGAGRTTTIAGFLLGTVSGSGVATTVTLGSVAWPMLKKSGYDRESGGAILSAAGIGAILSPPTLGAAAFLIAEFLQISYLEVLRMAIVPTILYYLCIFLMIELDARRMGTKAVMIETPPLLVLTRRYWYHFTSLIAIIVFMLLGYTPIAAVTYATLLAFLLSFLRRDTAITPRRLVATLRAGAVSTLSVASTCATAGIIVGIMTLTGLGLKMSDLIVDLANNNLFFTVLLTALAVWILGLAVPVTASYIIAAAITAPAMIGLGVPAVAAHMFIFYYAVLSEVSPPTALAPFAASAITGGNPFKTMMVTWKYTLPAFVVPFMFTLNKENGVNLLALGDTLDIVMATITACLAIVAMVAGVGGWIVRQAIWPERAILIVAAGFLFYTGTMQDLIGLGLMVVGILVHLRRV
ncbi:MAG: TRAP transporter fused permease subunit, partial [Chloroflexia bacterium]|nr:TRAP transporter fused permease subunit [Chloroflexia bacterium]